MSRARHTPGICLQAPGAPRVLPAASQLLMAAARVAAAWVITSRAPGTPLSPVTHSHPPPRAYTRLSHTNAPTQTRKQEGRGPRSMWAE
ncbi:hypothetical protein GDO81_019011 [Engystomops pustulosus]|uniref:Secreted protein n=1 Tax=Engystomops pustulosus TaxID=76066 RepID=A0AAV6YCS2_ENGPU|nr:hypothetical protein GDO81_019011 [Engystomops pustulosus]